MIFTHNLLKSHAPSPRKTARTATGQNSGDIKNNIYWKGWTARNILFLPAFHNFCNKVKTKKHDRYLLAPSWGRKSLSLLTSILNNCNSYKYLTTEPGYISYAFYTAGINCLSNWIKRPAKMVGKRCLHLFWVKVSFSCPLGYIYRQDEKKKRRVWKAKGFPFTFTVNAVQYILQLASMLAKLSDKERKKWSRYIAILSFHRGRKILEKFSWDLLFALSTRVNLFMSVQCYGLHGNWKGHNKSKPPFIRIK